MLISRYIAVLVPALVVCAAWAAERIPFASKPMSAGRASTIQVEKMKRLVQRSFEFDYVGINVTNENDTQLIELHPQILSAIVPEYSIRLEFQELLEKFEKTFLVDAEVHNDVCNRISMFLGNESNFSDSIRYRFFVQCIYRVEYTIVRMLFSGIRSDSRLRSVSNALDKALPIFMFDGIKANSDNAMIRAKIFREMLVLAIAIERRRLVKGILPTDIGELNLIHDSHSSIEYLERGGQWQLFSSVAVKSGNPAPFNVYLPFIEYKSTLPKSAYLWLSSDFSEKRRRLYGEGVINEEYPEWTCKMEHGKVSALK